MPDEDPHSSEDGSTNHSPVYDSDSFSRLHQFRYPDQLDIRAQPGDDVLSTQFSHYPSTLIPPLQAPLIHQSLQLARPTLVFQPSSETTLRSPSTYYPISLHQPTTPTSAVQSLITSPYSLENDLYYSNRQAIQPLSGRPMDVQPHDQTYSRLNEPVIASIPIENPPSVSASSSPLDSPPQPTTPPSHRKNNSTAVIACRQCRSRKIRCDSTRPQCNNCVRRSNTCAYDVVPKRRGPDKRPGTRKRSCKKRPTPDSTSSTTSEPPAKRRKADTTCISQTQFPSKENMAEDKKPLEHRTVVESFAVKRPQSPIIQREPQYPYSTPLLNSTFPRPIDTNVSHQSLERPYQRILTTPSSQREAAHKVWWNGFISNSGYSLHDLETHVKYLFTDTLHTLEFLNIDHFLRTLYRDDRRHTIHPAFVLAVLAMSTLMKSSNIENGEKGRREALALRDSAHQALEEAIASEWVDAAVAEAALILCLFESSAHPQYDINRHTKTLAYVSHIIQTLSLTTVDAHDADVCRFHPQTVPSVQLVSEQAMSKPCSCIPPNSPQPPDQHSTWSYPLPWDSSWADAQMRDEEHRRIAWCALGMVAQMSVQAAAFEDQGDTFRVHDQELWICDPSNYAILFPGEAMDRASPVYRSADSPSPKESVYSLYCRSMLLWVFCHYRLGRCEDDELKAEYAQEALGEVQFIQESLDFHTCNLDTGLIYLTREYISNIRVIAARCLRSFHGLFNPNNRMVSKRQGQEWVSSQELVIKRVTLSIQRVTNPFGHQLTRRPYQVTWYSNQLATCLMLWRHDNSHIPALQLAKLILCIVDIVNYLWPCPRHQNLCDDLRGKLIKACRTVGLDPPLGPEFSVPAIFRLRH